MTTCPTCGDEMETVAMEKDETGVVQALDQQCPSCGYGVNIAIVNYPDGRFTVIAPALDEDTCSACGGEATIRSQRVGRPIEGWCSEHVDPHYRPALDLRSEL